MKELLAFYKTSLGKKVLTEEPLAVEDAFKRAQDWSNTFSEQVIGRFRAEMKKKGDYIGLSLLPRDASPVRLSRRCNATGRKRAFIGRFQLSRIAFRELASNGMIPGVTKSSW